ncbi:MAG: CBS domain-containing protein [Gammaproteobacteria bacterium]|nr:CBS domain-containing protein [Gammaproteobacteria bacterium]
MLDKIRVKDVYIKIDDYPNISLHAPIGHAIHMMHDVLEDKTKYRTILVLDDDDHLKGYLSLRDLIRAVGPDYLHKKRPNMKGHQPFDFEGLTQDMSSLSLILEEGFTLKLQDELDKPVSEYMTLIEDKTSLDDHISKCLYLMLFRDVLVLPVVENDQVVGVVRLVDLFERIADSVEKVWLPKQK